MDIDELDYASDFCRCCLSIDITGCHQLLDMHAEIIYHKFQEKMTAYEGYFECAGVDIDSFHKIPIVDTKICQQCLFQLEGFIGFREVCRETNQKLQEKFAAHAEITIEPTHAIKLEIMDAVVKEEVGETELLPNVHYKNIEMKEEIFFEEGGSKSVNFETKCGVEDDDQALEIIKSDKVCLSKKQFKTKFTCSICYKTYKNEACAENHFAKEHEGELNDPGPDGQGAHIIKEPSAVQYRCPVCDKEFKLYTGLYDHNKRVHNSIGYPCTICKKIYKTYTGLSLHDKAVHLNMKYPCHLCTKVFNRKSMERHECKICKQEYRTSQDLWIHSFDHRGFVPFNCHKCKYKTRQKCNFRCHLKSRHKILFVEEVHGYKETFLDTMSFIKRFLSMKIVSFSNDTDSVVV